MGACLQLKSRFRETAFPRSRRCPRRCRSLRCRRTGRSRGSRSRKTRPDRRQRFSMNYF